MLLGKIFFFWEECENDRGICGGIMLHGQEDLRKAYYEIHTSKKRDSGRARRGNSAPSLFVFSIAPIAKNLVSF